MGWQEDLQKFGSQAYDAQRSFRERNPAVDFGLNFVPYIGGVAAADDVVNSLAAKKYGQAALDAIGLIPGGKLLSKGIDGMDAIDDALRRYMVANGNARIVNDVSGLANLAGYGAATVGAGVYVGSVADKQLNQKRDN